MAAADRDTASTADREIIITRTFDAPPELVWRAWTDPDHLAKWYGPDGFTTTTHSIDVRPGGEWRFDMRGPDGRVYPNRAVYDEVVAPSRLVWTHVGDEDLEKPVCFRKHVTFEQHGAQTKLTLRMTFPSAADRDRVIRDYGALDGALQTVGRLADHLARRASTSASGAHPGLTIALGADREIVMSRCFNAPREQVWNALTRPEFLKRWLLGPPGWEMTTCDNDLRVGGAYRCAWRNAGPPASEMAMHGVYREVEAHTRIVRTETFDFGCDAQAGEQIATLTLEPHAGGTRLTISVLFPSRQARDAAIASGMEHGVAAGYNRLDELLAELP